MSQPGTRTPNGAAPAGPAGGTTPVGGIDRTNDPQAQAPQRPGGGGAPGTGDAASSPEARHQQATGGKSRAESGTP